MVSNDKNNNNDSSIWLTDGTLAGTDNPRQRVPGSNGNEGILPNPQSFSTGAATSDAVWFYTQDTRCAEMQSLYSTAPADRVAESLS